MTVEPGKGKGVGQPVRRMGGTDTCICKKCGYNEEHLRGKPCNQLKCPTCGTPLQGK